MRRLTKLTRRQKEAVKKAGKDPALFLLVHDNGDTFDVMSRDRTETHTYTYTGKEIST